MTLKRFLQTVGAAGFMSLVLGFALAMPLTLHFNLPDRIEPVARYFCPETGTFAPRYFQARSARGLAKSATSISTGPSERVWTMNLPSNFNAVPSSTVSTATSASSRATGSG